MSPALAAVRIGAIAIAVLGVLDPAVNWRSREMPEVAIISVDPRDSALARETAQALEKNFAVVSGAYGPASATVIVGSALPDRLPAGRVFAVSDERVARIVAFSVARQSTTEARQPATIELDRPATSDAVIELVSGGVVVDRRELAARIGRDTVTLHHTPATTGALLVEARVIVGADTLVAHAVTDVADRPHSILFFDRRPSWLSTFIRRSVENDRRFSVASRVITSRSVSTDAGSPPSTLADPSLPELYDAIVVGAPTSLTAADVSGLESFLSRRGGAVVLLFDERPASGPLDRLTGAGAWAGVTERTPRAISTAGDSATLRAAELAWPVRSPADAVPWMSVRAGRADRPVLWARPAGAGQVIVNGALDAWKYRDVRDSRFDEYWRSVLSRAAREAAAPVAVELSSHVAAPGERLHVTVRLRDSAAVVAELVTARGSIPVRLAPGRFSGEYRGLVQAPADTGAYRVTARAGGRSAVAPLVVTTGPMPVVPDGSEAIATLLRASGGVAGSPREVGDAMRRMVVGEPREERWRIMREPWWIVVFAGLLGIEWLARRRSGLA